MDINFGLLVIVIGALLDSLVGDPYWMPHPIRLFGNMIYLCERKFNRGGARKFKGVVVWFSLLAIVYVFFTFIDRVTLSLPWIHMVWGAIFFFYGLSNRCLIEEGLKVERILQSGDLVAARRQLSMIVGRDTSNLSSSQIRSAVVETLSENLSDGVVAPLFYYALGGVPLMMCYKMVNTLDSMVGYKSDKYRDFGFFSAKMDDVANFIPARVTAFLMVLVSLSRRGLEFIFKYGRSHSSPNSGYPESALAGILNCRLGGPNDYFGVRVEKPYIGERARDLTHRDIVICCCINGGVALVCYLGLVISSLM